VIAEIAPGPRLILRGGAALLAVAFLAFVLYTATPIGGEELFGTWIYCGVMVGASASCLARAVLVGRERAAWTLIGLGLLIWTGGEIYYEAVLDTAGSVPVPSPADACYLLFYPLTYAGLIALLRTRIGNFPAIRWLDGLIAGLATAALVAALALGPIADAGGSGSTLEVATNLAYPIADLTLLTLVVTAAAFTGWRPGGTWALLGAGLLVLVGSDITYLLQAARGTYVEGGLLDTAWPLGALLLAAAAWVAPSPRRVEPSDGLRVAIVPVAAALLAIGVLAAERLDRIPATAEVLALVTLLLVIGRMAIALRRSNVNLASTEREALTDALTGLANRRALMTDLALTAARAPEPGNAHLFVMFDLDGFKGYNDAFGHPAGDALLARLAARLRSFAGERAAAYRLGGDEFCLLAECPPGEVRPLVAGATAALSERGEGFLVTASQGSVLIPSEAAGREDAMRLADARMYAQKSRERASAGSQSRDVLMRAQRERRPELHEHVRDVAELARAVAVELGMTAEERDEVFRAAELHDTGKIAIPDAILNKPGPLEPEEWSFMREHTLIGERIIAAAPALVPVARLVRSTHERWDGGGYPDGLRGEQIPLGSRVITVCDAYEAMLSVRPYSDGIGHERAVEELRRNAGTQFDERVVAAFERAVSKSEDHSRRP
jgi:two-component system cell cycle response regulator